ncbi:UNVERIFIED_CONTAM: virulence protein E, partial [Prevotella sp. 15_C9]
DTDHQQSGKGVDTSGKDLVRSCFLCHDPGALIRITNGE